uniref:Uncharacterized protein n=1 Tax=Chromera velia CCMP2878 TaxID=1169474 RepID=A0A0G4GQ10_9ALVE|mmetsp:Transcript_10843/g.20976  ORF Transcript_10843/g.20976 Transcript_10843/m.20976 type:complete len:126 (-) Transcript_10843:94-471(-)|eukprot:Cvel_22888.t1-p1 / transcript=Cvel_22888.t1 / gene=Cvel_22888 / organism=Chromera_velia_CCMP2878 / gene_product=hypothetical protein / transcript_product=hypothetical protein / location=Cvel_scaffold2299:5082-8079(+) / protein_length=125 / sequence_SO=supercontig / SO=protein_coding / is_pseudo=false
MRLSLVSFGVCIALMGPGRLDQKLAQAGATSHTNKVWRARRNKCVMNECSDIPEEENDDCVDKCLSPQCYQDIFAENPLEPGEVDRKRRNDFMNCVKKEVDVERRTKRKGPTDQSKSTGTTATEA